MKKTIPCIVLLVLSCLPVSAQEKEDANQNDADLLDKLKQTASTPANSLSARTVAIDAIGKFQNKDPKVRGKQKTILLNFLDDATLRKLKDDGDTVVFVTHVVQALGAMGNDARDALPTISRASGYEAGLTAAVHTACQAIFKSDAAISHAAKGVTELLADLANMKNAAARLAAVKALSELVEPSAITPLGTAAANDPDPDVRTAAGAALTKLTAVLQLNRKEYVTSLISMLDKANDVTVRMMAAKKLGSLGSDAIPAVDALTTASTDPDPDLKLVAQNALKRIQPKN